MKEIDETRLRRLPPPPLFTLRPPPKPPGKLFQHFQTGEIFNGQCQRPTLNFLNSSISSNDQQTFTWLNLFLLLMAVLSVICCFIIVVFIYICLKKLKKEEKQYRNYLMSDSLSLRNVRPTLIGHYQCPSRQTDDPTQFHQYECIPEYFLTFPRSNCHNVDQWGEFCTCSSSSPPSHPPLLSATNDVNAECSTPLLPSSTNFNSIRRTSSSVNRC